MFQNKHIIRLSFVGLFLAIIASIIFYRYFTLKNIVLDSYVKENNKIVSYLRENIWNEYINVVNIIQDENMDLDKVIKDENFRKFSSKTMSYLLKQSKEKISILSPSGKEFLTTSRSNFNKENLSLIQKTVNIINKIIFPYTPSKEAIKKAKTGESVHNIILNSTIGETKKSSVKMYIESFHPIFATNAHSSFYSNTGGIITFITDITEEWNEIQYFQKRVSIFLFSVFLLFFTIIIFNTHHAQRVIDQQVANNKSLEEAKIKAETESSAKTQFLANVSHELRTPLNAIIGFSEVILTEAYGKLQPQQYREYVDDINNSGKHLLSVINDILDFSKAASDKLNVDSIEVDLTKLVSSSIRFVKPRADEAKVNIVKNFPKEHLIINADPKRLKQALLNLLSNAVKFTPENGTVTLELEKNIPDQKVYIRVIDTGIGMEQKDIPKALSSFGQVDNKLSRRFEGTGLGLPLTKKLVELMDGKFEIISQPQIGTTVTITFKYEDF